MNIRPDLVELTFARGAEPTPHGLLKVEARKASQGLEVSVDIPEGVVAHVSVPATSQVTVNGKPETATAAETNTRSIVTLDKPGHFVVSGK